VVGQQTEALKKARLRALRFGGQPSRAIKREGWRRRESNLWAIPCKLLMYFALFDLEQIRRFLMTRRIRSNAQVEARNWNAEQTFNDLRGLSVLCEKSSVSGTPRLGSPSLAQPTS
jgi:hypothetical protein